MIYTIAGIYALAFFAWLAVRQTRLWKRRKRVRERLREECVPWTDFDARR